MSAALVRWRPSRPALLALALGLVSAFGFEPVGWWPVTLGALAALMVLVVNAATVVRALSLGWWFGLGHFALGLNWIATAFTFQAAMPAWLGWLAVVLLSLYLAVYPAAAAGLAWRWGRGRPLAFGLAFAAALIATEWLRATMFTGFAWNPLGVIFVDFGIVVRWIGTYGLSAIVVLTAAALAALYRGVRKDALLLALPFAATIVIALLTPKAPQPAPSSPRIRIVQPNINQNEKYSDELVTRNVHRLVDLTGHASRAPHLILWPEAAIPYFLEEDAEARKAFASLLGPADFLLTGGDAVIRDRAGLPMAARNSLFALNVRGRLLTRYDKSHLVPYGEYLPMRPILSAIGLARLVPGDIDFLPGSGPQTITLPGFGKAGIQICYEIIFSGHVVDRGNRPSFIFNPSNDAWFGSWGPPQHLAQARLRAMEEGLPVLRATPTGISAVIDTDGKILAHLPLGRAGAIEARLPPALPPPLFARAGNVLPFLLALALTSILIAVRRIDR